MTNALKATQPRRAWNPWPVMISAIFAAFFLGLVTFTIFASRQRMDLVRPDYYEEELRYQQQMERVTRTRKAGAPVTVEYDARFQTIRLRLPQTQAGRCSGQIDFYRPSDARLDRHVPLQLAADGSQTLDARVLREGLWKVQIRWSVDGKEYYFDRNVTVKRTGPS